MATLESLTADLRSLAVSLDQRFTSVDGKLDGIHGELRDLGSRVDFVQKEVAQMKDEQAHIFERVAHLEEQVSGMVGRLEDQENRNRRNNLVFHGIPEQPNESWEKAENSVRELISKEFNINLQADAIERAHRLKANSSPRPIIVKFLSFKAKEAVHDAFRVAVKEKRCQGARCNLSATK